VDRDLQKIGLACNTEIVACVFSSPCIFIGLCFSCLLRFRLCFLFSVVDDHSRVVLNDYGPQFDYINASYISVNFVFI